MEPSLTAFIEEKVSHALAPEKKKLSGSRSKGLMRGSRSK
jgi:hypothetical protein